MCEGYDLPLLHMYHYVLKSCVHVRRPPSIMLKILPKMLLGIAQNFPYYAQTPSYYARLC